MIFRYLKSTKEKSIFYYGSKNLITTQTLISLAMKKQENQPVDTFSYLEKVQFHGNLKLRRSSHYQPLKQNMLH